MSDAATSARPTPLPRASRSLDPSFLRPALTGAARPRFAVDSQEADSWRAGPGQLTSSRVRLARYLARTKLIGAVGVAEAERRHVGLLPQLPWDRPIPSHVELATPASSAGRTKVQPPGDVTRKLLPWLRCAEAVRKMAAQSSAVLGTTRVRSTPAARPSPASDLERCFKTTEARRVIFDT